MAKFDPGKIGLLLSDERYAETDPTDILIGAGLKKGDVFGDIGCGPGFFTIPASYIVGREGMVYALDVQEEMLEELRKRRPPENVRIVRSLEDSIPLDEETLDLALLAYVLHEVERGDTFLREVRRVLRSGATLVVLEWEKMEEEKGPPFEERISKEDAKRMLEEGGFRIVKSENLNPSHYYIHTVKA